MSVAVMSEVWKRFPDGGGLMLTALALADHAHDDGTRVFPSVAALAAKTRQSDRTIQRQLRALEACGWLIMIRESSGKPGDTNTYRICPQWLAGKPVIRKIPDAPDGMDRGDNLSPPQTGDNSEGEQGETGDIDDQTGDTAMSPEPSVKQTSRAKQPSPTRKRAANREHAEHTLPSWIPASNWEAWLEMRSKKRAYLTPAAVVLAFNTLSDLRREGNAPDKVLDQSTLNNWTGLFHVKQVAKRDTSSANAAAGEEFIAGIQRDYGVSHAAE